MLLQRRVVAVHQVALRAQHAHQALRHTQNSRTAARPAGARRAACSSSQGSWKLTLLRPLMRWRRSVSTSVLWRVLWVLNHPVPLSVEEVGLVRELQDGAARIERGLHLLPDPLRHLLLRKVRRCLVAPPSSFTGSQSLRSMPAPAFRPPPATDDHQHVDQVLVVLVAEEALVQLGQPVLPALQGAHELLLPVAQQDVVVGPLAEGLVAVEVLEAAGPGGSSSCLAQLAILFLRGRFFLVAFSPAICVFVAVGFCFGGRGVSFGGVVAVCFCFGRAGSSFGVAVAVCFVGGTGGASQLWCRRRRPVCFCFGGRGVSFGGVVAVCFCFGRAGGASQLWWCRRRRPRRPRPACQARAKVGILPRKKISKLSSKPTVSANLPGRAAPARRHGGTQLMSRITNYEAVTERRKSASEPAVGHVGKKPTCPVTNSTPTWRLRYPARQARS